MLKKTFQNKMDAIRKGAINVTSNVLSSPARYKAKKAMEKSDRFVKAAKVVRDYKSRSKAPNALYVEPTQEEKMAMSEYEWQKMQMNKKK